MAIRLLLKSLSTMNTSSVSEINKGGQHFYIKNKQNSRKLEAVLPFSNIFPSWSTELRENILYPDFEPTAKDLQL